MKIVLNKCFGGFGLSDKQKELLKLDDEWIDPNKIRTHPDLVMSVIDGDKGDKYAQLEVVEIPDGAYWNISDYDGIETLIWSMTEIGEQ